MWHIIFILKQKRCLGLLDEGAWHARLLQFAPIYRVVARYSAAPGRP